VLVLPEAAAPNSQRAQAPGGGSGGGNPAHHHYYHHQQQHPAPATTTTSSSSPSSGISTAGGHAQQALPLSPPVVKLLDFGLSKLIDPKGGGSSAKTFVGTRAYLAPEVELLAHGQGRDYGCPADCWSMGAVLHVMLVAKFPEFDVVHRVDPEGILTPFSGVLKVEGIGLWDTLSSTCKDLIKRLMTPNAEKRMTAREALEHPWTRGLSFLPADYRPPSHRGVDFSISARTSTTSSSALSAGSSASGSASASGTSTTKSCCTTGANTFGSGPVPPPPPPGVGMGVGGNNYYPQQQQQQQQQGQQQQQLQQHHPQQQQGQGAAGGPTGISTTTTTTATATPLLFHPASCMEEDRGELRRHQEATQTHAHAHAAAVASVTAAAAVAGNNIVRHNNRHQPQPQPQPPPTVTGGAGAGAEAEVHQGSPAANARALHRVASDPLTQAPVELRLGLLVKIQENIASSLGLAFHLMVSNRSRRRWRSACGRAPWCAGTSCS
jgi:hypothetical protein